MKHKVTPQMFMSSLSYDKRLALYDIKGSIVHAAMLGRQGIIPKDDSRKIIQGLTAILEDIKKGKSLPEEEDVHMAVEKELIRRIGPAGGKLHTARSRNDQVALDIRLYLKECIKRQIRLLNAVQRTIISLAKKQISVILPGMTHLQHAQPVLLSHHLLAYGWMFQRDKSRMEDCLERMDESPLGSAALAGTSFPIDREYTARKLGFKKPTENSIDSVSDRDCLIEYLSAGAILMSHLSRIAEDLVIWSSQEFGFVMLGDSFTSGSSIMPQKKNPDFAEIVRGKSGRIYGGLMGLLTLVKGIPLTYNRDLQEDKPLLFDAVDTIDQVLGLCDVMFQTLSFNGKRMLDACRHGFLEATELADYLVQQGIPFRKAHGIVKDAVRYCAGSGRQLSQLTVKELQKFSKQLDAGALPLLHTASIVQRRNSYGGTAAALVKVQIEKLRKLIS